MKKKTTAILLTTAMAVSMLASVGTVEAKAEENLSGTITYLQHRTDLGEEIDQMVAAFNELYPDVTVKVETSSTYDQTVQTRAAGNELPDVIEVGPGEIPAVKWPEYFLPLNDSAVADKLLCTGLFVVDGNLYGLPQQLLLYGMMYNKDLYAQAGITEVPTTWEEFEAALEKLSALDGIIPFTSQYKTTWAQEIWIDELAASVIRATSGEDEDWRDNFMETDAPFSNDVIVTILNNYKSIADKGYCDPDLMSSDWDLQAADFAAGRIGTYLTGNFAYSTMVSLGMDPEKIGFYAFPVSDMTEEGKSVVMSASERAFMVSKETENVDAAVAFAEFCAENYTIYTNGITAVAGQECVIAPINEMLSTDPIVVEDYQVSDAVQKVYSIGGISIGELVQNYVVAEDPQSVLDTFNDMWKTALADYNG